MALLIRRLLGSLGIAMLALCLLLVHDPVLAQGASLERQVKAAYLVRFGGFVEWPEGTFASPDTPLQIGFVAGDALADQVEQMAAGRNTGGRPVVIRRIRRGDSLTGLHILFIGATDKATATELLTAARGQAVLTVTDSEDVAAQGSMVNFVVASERLRFEVALNQVTAGRLRISARMLAVAHKVLGAS